MIETRRFPVQLASVGGARRFASEALAGAPADVIDAVELMVSELATNCIRHASAEFELTIVRRRGQIRVEVTDQAAGTPTMRSPKPQDPTGRGLQIVDLLSDTWGVVERRGQGKTVWFALAAALDSPPPTGAARAQPGAIGPDTAGEARSGLERGARRRRLPPPRRRQEGGGAESRRRPASCAVRCPPPRSRPHGISCSAGI